MDHGHPPDQQVPCVASGLAAGHQAHEVESRPGLQPPHPALGQDPEPACPVKARSTPVQVQPLSLGSKTTATGHWAPPMDSQVSSTSTHSPTGPGDGTGPGNRCCAHTGRPPVHGRSCGCCRDVTSDDRGETLPRQALHGQRCTPSHPGTSRWRAWVPLRCKRRAGSVGVRGRQEPGLKSTTRGPVGFGRTKPSAGAPRPLPGPEPMATRLKQCPASVAGSPPAVCFNMAEPSVALRISP